MSAEKCMVCDETANDEDEISYAAGDGVWFHNQCFKCSQCDEHLLVFSLMVLYFVPYNNYK